MSVPPFMTYLGVELDSMADGEAEAHLELAPHHLNRRGVVHGGVISALLDTALGAAVISSIPREWWCATISLSVQFLEGARGGRLSARGRVLRRGRRVAFARGEVLDEGGRQVAAAEGSWHLWPHKPGALKQPRSTGYVVLQESGLRLRVGKILAVGRNYAKHVAEMGYRPDAPPVVFFKPASAIVHDGGVVHAPRGAGELHHEVELVAVIGKRTCRVSPERAAEHVLGYAVGLDMTLRDVQKQAKAQGEPWAVAKGFDGCAPVSSVVLAEKVGDGSGLAIALDVNGRRRQEGNTSQMLWSVAKLVSWLSQTITLERGDLVFTGTPEGVGPVEPGDRLEASLQQVGTLRLRIGEAPATPDGPTPDNPDTSA